MKSLMIQVLKQVIIPFFLAAGVVSFLVWVLMLAGEFNGW